MSRIEVLRAELLKSDAAVGNSKILTVPPGKQWTLRHILAKVTSTATVGSRRIQMRILDPSANIVYWLDAGAVQAASLVWFYHFMPGVAREAAIVSASILCPMPPDISLGPGWQVQIRDGTAVDALDTVDVEALLEQVEA